MKSYTLKSYDEWLKSADKDQAEFVDRVYKMCEDHYDAGGDVVVEAMTPDEVLEEFETLEDAKRRCGLVVEQSLNARWGEDGDPEVETAHRFDAWERLG